MSEEDVVTKWREKHPVVLGGLLDTAVEVLAVLPKVQRKGLPRMADFARLLIAVDKVLGTTAFDRFVDQAGRTAEQVADSDNVLVAIRTRIIEPWTGTASDLLNLLTPDKPPKDWPPVHRRWAVACPEAPRCCVAWDGRSIACHALTRRARVAGR